MDRHAALAMTISVNESSLRTEGEATQNLWIDTSTYGLLVMTEVMVVVEHGSPQTPTKRKRRCEEQCDETTQKTPGSPRFARDDDIC